MSEACYPPTEEEERLMNSQQRTSELVYLQRNSYRKLQEVIVKGRTYYHSIQDEQELLRLLIFSLVAKVHLKQTQLNQQYLNTLKSLIYGSQLTPELTTQRGIQREQLLKMFAEKMTGLPISEEVEEELCRTINCTPFFEEVLVTAAVEDMISTIGEAGKFAIRQTCTEWFKERFGIMISITEQPLSEEKQNELFVKKEQHFLRQAFKEEELFVGSEEFNASDKEQDLKQQPTNIHESIVITDMSTSNLKGTLNASKLQQIKERNSERTNKTGRTSRGGGSVFDLFCCCECSLIIQEQSLSKVTPSCPANLRNRSPRLSL